MSDKVYRIVVVALLSLILVVIGINTFSQIRGQRRNAELNRERSEASEARSERAEQERFEQNQGRQRQPQNLFPQRDLEGQLQPLNQELLENLHNLAVQNEEQGNLIRDLFGQIEELRHQLAELSEQVEILIDVGEGE